MELSQLCLKYYVMDTIHIKKVKLSSPCACHRGIWGRGYIPPCILNFSNRMQAVIKFLP